MQFNSTVEEFGYDNQSWLGSRRGTHTARTVTIGAATVAEFDGFIPSVFRLRRVPMGSLRRFLPLVMSLRVSFWSRSLFVARAM